MCEEDGKEIFCWKTFHPGDFVLQDSPIPGEILSLLDWFYNPPCWPGGRPQGEADDMRISRLFQYAAKLENHKTPQAQKKSV